MNDAADLTIEKATEIPRIQRGGGKRGTKYQGAFDKAYKAAKAAKPHAVRVKVDSEKRADSLTGYLRRIGPPDITVRQRSLMNGDTREFYVYLDARE